RVPVVPGECGGGGVDGRVVGDGHGGEAGRLDQRPVRACGPVGAVEVVEDRCRRRQRRGGGDGCGGVGCGGGGGGGDEGGDGGADVGVGEGVGGGGRAGDGDAVVAGVVAVAPLLGD